MIGFIPTKLHKNTLIKHSLANNSSTKQDTDAINVKQNLI